MTMDDAMLKDKEEVQDYLKNLCTEYKYSCYGEKNPEGCQLLGDFFAQIEGDYVKANRVFSENCEKRSYGRSCSSFGLNLLGGRGTPKNPAAAFEHFVKACDADDAVGCDFAGKLLTGCEPSLSAQAGGPIKTDVVRGLAYLEHGCQLKSSAQMFESSESCYAAAFFYAAGLKGGVLARDDEKAIALGSRACELGQMRACKLVGDVYQRAGKPEQAEPFHRRFAQMERQIKEQVSLEMQRT